MPTVTDSAREALATFAEQGLLARPALRIALADGSSPVAPDCELTLVDADDAPPRDHLIESGDVRLLLDPDAADALRDAAVDYDRGAFVVRLPPPPPPDADAPLEERVRHVLDTRVNPGVAAHGGSITLAEVRGTEVFLQMSGGCQGCGMARVTLRQGVERMIREAMPEVTAVHDVTDHRSGANPYYQPA